MWKEGSLKVHDSVFHYWMKQYDEGSQFGIDGGRVSKLMELRSDIYLDWRDLCDDSAIRYKKICYFYIPLPDIRYVLYDVSEIFDLDDNDYCNIQCEFMQALLDQGEYSKKEVWESISDRESSLEWQDKSELKVTTGMPCACSTFTFSAIEE